jgi:hypothetical protein
MGGDCANGCGRQAKGKGRYCSDSCRAKASHKRNYVKVKPRPPYSGPVCWCGDPAKFEDSGRPKCGNHALGHRSERDRWRKLVKELRLDYGTVEAVREALKNKAA